MKTTSSTLTFVLAGVLGIALLSGCDRRSPTMDQPGMGGMPSSNAPVSPPSSMMPAPPAMPGASGPSGTPGSPPPDTSK